MATRVTASEHLRAPQSTTKALKSPMTPNFFQRHPKNATKAPIGIPETQEHNNHVSRVLLISTKASACRKGDILAITITSL